MNGPPPARNNRRVEPRHSLGRRTNVKEIHIAAVGESHGAITVLAERILSDLSIN